MSHDAHHSPPHWHLLQTEQKGQVSTASWYGEEPIVPHWQQSHDALQSDDDSSIGAMIRMLQAWVLLMTMMERMMEWHIVERQE